MTRRRPTRRTGKYAFQASAQSASSDDPDPQLADRPQAERLEVAERIGHLDRGAVGGRSVARRQVGADDGGPGRIDRRAEALVDQLERGLDATFRRAPPGRGSR